MKLADMMEQRLVQIEQSVGKQMDDNIGKMERYVKDILDQNRLLFCNAMREVSDNITAYDVNDMRAVSQTQKVALEDALTKNACLVAENSELQCICLLCQLSIATMWNTFRRKTGSCIATNDANLKSSSRILTTRSVPRSTWRMHPWQTGTCNSPFAMHNTPLWEKPVLRWIEVSR